DAVTMIQRNVRSPGTPQVASRVGQPVSFGLRGGATLVWHGPGFLTSGVTGNPVLIQGRYGIMGNFELVVPSSSGGLVHYSRNNDDPTLPWSGPTFFGQSLGLVDAATMIQSNFGSPGNLEVVSR